jgi:putative peptidoglycan lipid II flippase
VLTEFAVLSVSVRSLGYPLAPGWSGINGALRSVIVQFAPVVGATALLGCVPLIDNAMAAGLAAGSVSVLAFGTKLSTVVISMGPGAIGTAILPRLSSMAAQGEWSAMLRRLGVFTGLVLLIVIPTVAAMVVLSEPLVRLVLQKGAFTEASTLAVAHVQRYSLLQIPFATLTALGFKLAASLKLNQLVLPAAAVGVAVTLIADYALREVMGVAGIALAASVSQVCVLATMAFLLKRRFDSMQTERLLE